MTKPKAKPPAIFAEHLRYGNAQILAVRALDSSVLVADVRFDDGSERTIRLAQEYWSSDLKELLKVTPKKPATTKKRIEPIETEGIEVVEAS